MPDIGGGGEAGGLGDESPAAGSRGRAPIVGLGDYSGPKILCFATQSVL